MQEIERYLRESDVFRILNDEEIRKISPHFRILSCAKGEVIVREDEEADRFFIIQSGSMEIWKDHEGSKPIRLAVQKPGSIFGEMALIDEEPRSATVVAAEPSLLLAMSKEDFFALSEDHPRMMFAVLRALSRMIRNSNDSFIQSLSRQNEELQQALHDLKSAQKELIRAERFSNLGKLAGLIVHDLRNPLSVIKGYGEMLQVLCGEPELVRDQARKIVQEAERMNQFAQELLDYSRGDVRLRWTFTSFPMIFQKINSYLSKSIDENRIRLALRHHGSSPFYVDEERLIRAILNLCDNAAKAMGDGGTLEVSGEFEQDFLLFQIKDDGHGMDEDVLAHIFEPFYSSSSRGGTGLGMVSVKTIVEAHKGVVQINSAPGKGTSVSLRLPRIEVLPE